MRAFPLEQLSIAFNSDREKNYASAAKYFCAILAVRPRAPVRYRRARDGSSNDDALG
jgi:hypothetical protein